MHDCLRVPEILDQILTIVLEDQPGIKGRNNVVSVALSCREFLEIALDVSWKTQSSMVPLIKTLPSRCWKDAPSSLTNRFSSFDSHFNLLVKKLTVGDEKRFMFYAKRIRKLEYLPFAYHVVPKDGGPYDLQIIRTIWATRTDKTHPLFPNLQHLVFAVIDHAAVSLDVFLQTKQVSLALYWNDSAFSVKAADKTTPLFSIIEKHALNMQELDLGDFQDFQRHPRGHDTALSELVCKMTDLRVLSTGSRPLNALAIQHLSSLPHLRKLRVPNNSQEISPGVRKHTYISPFPELQEFVLRETEFPSFVSLMKELRPIHIQNLVIQICHIPRSGEILNVFVALAEESSSVGNIHWIEIKFIPDPNIARRGYHRQNDPMNPFALDKCVTQVDGNTLEPLLSFINLTVLNFDVPCKFKLGDPEIKAMADAWPRLRRLKLGSYLGWHHPSTITYDGFLYLLLKCPELTDLAFAFDAASHIPTTIAPGHVNMNISYLYIGDSRIGMNSHDSVGKFLAVVFPKCRGISGEWIMGSSSSNQTSSNCSEWEAVVVAMKKHQEPKEVADKERITGEAPHKTKFKFFG